MTLALAGREVRAVVCDLDGVLADTAAGWARAEEELCRAYSDVAAPKPAPDVYLAAHVAPDHVPATPVPGSATTADGHHDLLAQLGLPDPHPAHTGGTP